MRTLLLAGAGVLLVAGCGGGGEQEQSAGQLPEPSLQGRTFLSEAVSERGKAKELVAGTQVSVVFKDDGWILVQAGCNSISGPVGTDNGRLSVSSLAVTEIGCDQAKQQQDSWLAGLLQSGPAWRLEGEKLRLTSADAEIVLAPKADSPIAGTQWLLDTVTVGDLAQSSDRTATLVFGQDTVQITTECNSGRASYRANGDKMVFDGVGLTRKVCPDELMQAEQAIVPVLDGEVTVKVAGDILQITHPSGNGLRLHAQS
jgi:heat shock protein HslJ